MTSDERLDHDHRAATRSGVRRGHPSARHHLARVSARKSDQPARERVLDDLAAALALLQQDEPLLQRNFGLSWSDVASAVQDEAARRQLPATSVARLLVTGLRVDEARSSAAMYRRDEEDGA